MNSECCICFELVRQTDKQNPFATRCGHIFHENCINNCLEKQSKCPQCNQPTIRSQLVRLYINEPGNATEAKDESIERLKLQLNELNEKAQLQYDLIAALNRQIKEKSQSESNGDTNTKHLLASAKLKVERQPNLGKTRPSYSFDFGVNKAATHSKTFMPSTFTGNDKVKNSLFNFGDQNRSDNQRSTSSVPLTTFQSIPVEAKRDLYKELGRLMFGENSSEFSQNLIPNEAVSSENPIIGLSTLRDEIQASLTKVEANSVKNKIGKSSDTANVKPGFGKSSFWSGLSGASSGPTSKFYWYEPTVSIPAKKLLSGSSTNSKENPFQKYTISTNPSGSEATTSSGSLDMKATSSRGAKKMNLSPRPRSLFAPRVFTDPSLQNINEFFSNIPKSSVLIGSALASTVEPTLENRTGSLTVSNNSSNDIFVGPEMPAEKK